MDNIYLPQNVVAIILYQYFQLQQKNDSRDLNPIYLDNALLNFFVKNCLHFFPRVPFNNFNQYLFKNSTDAFMTSVRFNSEKFSNRFVRSCMTELVDNNFNQKKLIMALSLIKLEKSHLWFGMILPWITSYDHVDFFLKFASQAETIIINFDYVLEECLKSAITHDSVNLYLHLAGNQDGDIKKHIDYSFDYKSCKIFSHLLNSHNFDADYLDDLWMKSMFFAWYFPFKYLLTTSRLTRLGIKALNTNKYIPRFFDWESKKNIHLEVLHGFAELTDFQVNDIIQKFPSLIKEQKNNLDFYLDGKTVKIKEKRYESTYNRLVIMSGLDGMYYL